MTTFKNIKKVSVVIPAYNKADFTIRTIESVLNQTYTNIEIIVVDDGSTDDTPRKIIKYNDQVTYIRKENGGACSARNAGIKAASGDYVALIDCDDIYYPEKIQKSVECLASDPEIGFVYNSAYFINEDDEIVSEYKNFGYDASGRITKKLLEYNIICNSTVVIKKECFKHVGYFDESIFIPADWDMWIRLSEVYKAGYVDEKLTGYRVSHTYTINHVEKGLKEELYILDKSFKRQTKVPHNLKKRCLANIFYRYGLMNLAQENYIQAKKLFFNAFKRKPFDLKLGFLSLASVLFPSLLFRIVKLKLVV